jgi:hypothetical protein
MNDEGGGRRVGKQRSGEVCSASDRVDSVVVRRHHAHRCGGRSAGDHHGRGGSWGKVWTLAARRLALQQHLDLAAAEAERFEPRHVLRCAAPLFGLSNDGVLFAQPFRVGDAGAAASGVGIAAGRRLVMQLVTREVRARLCAAARATHNEAGGREILRRRARRRGSGGRRRGEQARRCDERRRRKRRRSGECRGRGRCDLLGRCVAVAGVCLLLNHSMLLVVVCRIRAW